MGEADLRVPHVDLAQLGVHGQELRGCVVCETRTQPRELCPAWGLASSSQEGKRSRGCPWGSGSALSCPPQSQCLFWEPLGATLSVPWPGWCRGGSVGAASAATAVPGDKVLLCPYTAVPELNPQPSSHCPGTPAWNPRVPIPVSWAHSLGSFSWSLLSKLGTLLRFCSRAQPSISRSS